MKEAEIQCICPSYHIQDLGLQMVKGQVEHVPISDAGESRDLLRAVRIKAVQIRYVERARQVRPPNRAHKTRPSGHTPQPVATHAPETTPPPIDTAALVAEIASLVESRLRPIIGRIAKDIKADVAQTVKSTLAELMPVTPTTSEQEEPQPQPKEEGDTTPTKRSRRSKK